MHLWSREIADAVFFDIRFGLRFKVGSRLRPATDAEIDVVARAIVERLQQSNWLIQRGLVSPRSAKLICSAFCNLGAVRGGA